MLAPAGKVQGIFAASLGLTRALKNRGVKAARFVPFGSGDNGLSVCPETAFKQIASGEKFALLEQIVANYNRLLNTENPDVVIIEGLTSARFNKDELNADETLINFKNCLLRVTADSLTSIPHTLNVYSTIKIPCNWTGKPSPTPEFDSYMDTLTNREKAVT